MLEGDRRWVIITRKHLASDIRSLCEDLGSGLVPDYRYDLEDVEARLPNRSISYSINLGVLNFCLILSIKSKLAILVVASKEST